MLGVLLERRLDFDLGFLGAAVIELEINVSEQAGNLFGQGFRLRRGCGNREGRSGRQVRKDRQSIDEFLLHLPGGHGWQWGRWGGQAIGYFRGQLEVREGRVHPAEVRGLEGRRLRLRGRGGRGRDEGLAWGRGGGRKRIRGQAGRREGILG